MQQRALRTHARPVRDVYRGHSRLRLQRQTTRRARPAGRFRTSEGEMALFCETLIWSISTHEALSVSISGPRKPQRLPKKIGFVLRQPPLRIHLRPRRRAKLGQPSGSGTLKVEWLCFVKRSAGAPVCARRPHKHAHEPKIGCCRARPAWSSVLPS